MALICSRGAIKRAFRALLSNVAQGSPDDIRQSGGNLGLAECVAVVDETNNKTLGEHP